MITAATSAYMSASVSYIHIERGERIAASPIQLWQVRRRRYSSAAAAEALNSHHTIMPLDRFVTSFLSAAWIWKTWRARWSLSRSLLFSLVHSNRHTHIHKHSKSAFTLSLNHWSAPAAAPTTIREGPEGPSRPKSIKKTHTHQQMPPLNSLHLRVKDHKWVFYFWCKLYTWHDFVILFYKRLPKCGFIKY